MVPADPQSGIWHSSEAAELCQASGAELCGSISIEASGNWPFFAAPVPYAAEGRYWQTMATSPPQHAPHPIMYMPVHTTSANFPSCPSWTSEVDDPCKNISGINSTEDTAAYQEEELSKEGEDQLERQSRSEVASQSRSAAKREDSEVHLGFVKHESKSYASSDASTVVSRSARRRRHRRAIKAKESKSAEVGVGMLVSEASCPAHLSVSKDQKNEMVADLEAGGERKSRVVQSLLGCVFSASLEPHGCRIVQAALEFASSTEREALASELRLHVREAICSPHANFVIQKVIEVLPVASASFIAEELATVAADSARHRFGCRILCRLVEHHLCGGATSPSTSCLVDELLLEADRLITNSYARHVMEMVLEHGNHEHKHKIAKTIRRNAFSTAKNRNGSYVMEKALSMCSVEDAQSIASELLSNPASFHVLVMHECGCHVVKAIMRLHSCDHSKRAKDLVMADGESVKTSKHGRQLLDNM
jgi:hypothetical protein